MQLKLLVGELRTMLNTGLLLIHGMMTGETKDSSKSSEEKIILELKVKLALA
jgi:hypothetical protein